MGETGRHKRRRGQPPGYRPPNADNPAGREAALRRSRQLRKERAAIKVQIKNGKIDGILLIAGHYDELEESIAGWPIGTAVRSIPNIGPKRTHEILSVFGHGPHTKLGRDLTFKDRKLLAELCREAKEIVIGIV